MLLVDVHDPYVIRRLIAAGADVYAQTDDMNVLHYHVLNNKENTILSIAKIESIDHHRLIHGGRRLARDVYLTLTRAVQIEKGEGAINQAVLDYLTHGSSKQRVGVVTKKALRK